MSEDNAHKWLLDTYVPGVSERIDDLGSQLAPLDDLVAQITARLRLESHKAPVPDFSKHVPPDLVNTLAEMNHVFVGRHREIPTMKLAIGTAFAVAPTQPIRCQVGWATMDKVEVEWMWPEHPKVVWVFCPSELPWPAFRAMAYVADSVEAHKLNKTRHYHIRSLIKHLGKTSGWLD